MLETRVPPPRLFAEVCAGWNVHGRCECTEGCPRRVDLVDVDERLVDVGRETPNPSRTGPAQGLPRPARPSGPPIATKPGRKPGAELATPAVGAVVVPLPHTCWLGDLVPEVPHTVLAARSEGGAPAALVVVRTVVHEQLAAAQLPAAEFTPYAVYLYVDQVRLAVEGDVDEAVRFRLGGVSVHEVVAARSLCPASRRRRALVRRLQPTVDPVDCRACLRITAARAATGVSV